MKKKIALVGNMNNSFSALCRYLLDEGYDVHLFPFTTDPLHFHPQSDTFEGQLDGRIHVIDWCIPAHLISYKLEKVKEDMATFDFIIACGAAIAYLYKANIKIDVFIPYGSDIYSLPRIEWSYNPIYFFKRLYFRHFQLQGIRKAGLIIMERQSPWVEDGIAKIKFTGRREMMSFPALHVPTYQDATVSNERSLKYFDTYKQIRDAHELVVFHQSRHSWKNPIDKVELKGNDILFKGFKKFTEQNPNVKACIVTLEYGGEVKESKKLIEELQLQEYVKWLPKQDRKELMMGIKMSDVVVGELYMSYNLYGVIIEGLAMSKPIMQNRNDIEYASAYNTLHPIIFAEDTKSVCEGLENIIHNPEKYKQIGVAGKQWYIDNIVNKVLGIINQEIKAKYERQH